MEEQRAYPRVPIELQARYKIHGSSVEESIILLNIGPGGAYFISPTAILPHLDIELTFLVETKTVSFKAKVVWNEFISTTKGYRVGLKIVDMNRADEERFIQFYCKRLFDVLEKSDQDKPKERGRDEE